MGSIRIHTYLRGKNTSTINIPREEINALLWLGDLRESLHDVDPRDRRAICIFDGTLLQDGISHGSMVLGVESASPIETPFDQTSKSGDHFQLRKLGGSQMASVRIGRIALALVKGLHVVQRYDDRSLRKIYTVIKVENKHPGRKGGPLSPFEVTWMNSSW